MKHTIRNWKSLGKVLQDNKYKDCPVAIDYEDGKLSSITFETRKVKK